MDQTVSTHYEDTLKIISKMSLAVNAQLAYEIKTLIIKPKLQRKTIS